MTRTKILRFSLLRLMVICFAASKFQVHANHVVDFALEPPLLTVVQAGHSAVLDCAIQAVNYTLDAIHIQWLDGDGQPIAFLGDIYRSQLLNNSLYISPVLPDKGLTGQYQCKATVPNGAGSIVSRRARLELAWLGDFEEEPTEEIFVFLGEKVHFPCRIAGQPVRVRWLKDERPLTIDELRMTILPNGGLEIDEISETDQGTYRCNASSMNLHKVSSRATLVLNSDLVEATSSKPPAFIVQPQSRVTATEGQTVTLDCAANGNPRPKVKWLKDGANIDMADLDSRFSNVGTTSSLRISNIKEEDAGSYQCLAENREDSIDASSTVQVQIPPKFKRKPSDKIEYVSKEVELECVVYGRPEPQVQWLKNGELIHPNGYHQIVNGNNLKIMGLLLSDTGLFQCVATNAAGNVQGSASLKVFNQNNSSNKQQHRNNKKQRNRKKFNNSQQESPKSLLPSNAPDDGPSRTSQALFASLQTSSSQQLVRPNPPNSFQILTSLSSSSASSSSHLGSTLNAYSHEPATSQQHSQFETPPYNQRKQKHKQQQQHTFDESMFDEDDDDDDDDDVDLNSKGGSSWSVDVDDSGHVTGGRPGPPLDVAVLVAKARFMVIAWKVPAVNHDDVTIYSVFYRQNGNQRERVQNTTVSPGSSRRSSTYRSLEEAHLSNLQPSTTYMVRVAAWNHLGMGQSSPPLAITTAFEENNVPGVPRQVRAHATSSRSAHVQWLVPEVLPSAGNQMLDGTGADIRYRVNYMEYGGERHVMDIVDTQVDLISLEPHTLYTVSVEAVNAHGPSQPTDAVTVRTFSAAPTEPPQNVTFEAATTSTALIVCWEPPPQSAQNGAITGYKIRYRIKGNKADTYTVEGGQREWAIRGVERGSAYQVRLWAMNVNGTGPPTDWLDVDMKENVLDESRVPDAPGELRTKATGNSITVYWTPPHIAGVRVRNYIIGWGKGIPDMFSQELGERDREFTIAPLESQSEYVVSLRASNEIGAGVPKYANIRTVVDAAERPGGDAEDVPLLPPIGVKAQVLGDNSVVMYWTDTHSRGGGVPYSGGLSEGRYYVVHYQAEGLKAKEMNVSTNNVLLSDLRPGTMYEFTVKLVKGRRESPWSMVVANATTSGPSSSSSGSAAAPRELQVKLLQDDSQMIRLSWLPPKPSGTNINGYVILYTTDQSKRDRDWNATAVKGDRLTCEMAHLEPNTRYYFKVHARINKGNGPFSAIVTIETGPNIGTPPPVNKAGVFSGTMLLYLIGGALILVVATILLAIVCLCCRGRGRDAHMTLGGTQLGTSPDRSKKGYQGVSSGGGMISGMGGVKPPDLWIHHDQMELKQMDCGKDGDTASSSTALTLPRGSSCDGDDYDRRGGHHHHHAPTHHHHLNSLDKRGYAPAYMDDSNCQYNGGNNTIKRQAINTIDSSPTTVTATLKPKPLTLMQVVMQQQHSPRDPVATASSTINASGLNTSISSTTPLSYHDRDQSMSTPVRPSISMVATPQQYSSQPAHAQAMRTVQYVDQNVPQQQQYSNAATVTTYDPYSTSGGYGTTTAGGAPPLGSSTITGCVQHPLKSFTVPAPPPVSAPGTPKLVVTLSPPLPVSYYQVRPQTNQQSPYKRPSVVAIASPCIGGNAGGSNGDSGISTPPQAVLRGANSALPPHSSGEVQRLTEPGGSVRPSHSTEELNQEMEHLKGLMITLNKITANEFEC